MKSPLRTANLPCWALMVAIVCALPACGSRTGFRLPDLSPFRPPLCTDETGTMRISVLPDALVPTTHTIRQVELTFRRICSVPDAADPSQPSEQVITQNCTITMPASGNVASRAGCIAPLAANPGAVWSLGTVNTQPNNMFVEIVGRVQGKFCVSGFVTLADGRTVTLEQYSWPARFSAPRMIPQMGYSLTRNDTTDPLVNPLSRAAPGCV